MENKFLNRFSSTISLHIEGKNIEKFLKRLHTNKINILKIQYLSIKEAIIKIYLKDYEKVLNIKTIYEISILNYGGKISFYKLIKRNKFFLITCLLGIIFLYFLSHIIFDVEIIHNDTSLRKLLLEELENHGIKEYHFTKSFKEVEQIKKQIIDKYRDTIEWLEIEKVGVKYQVRVEERKLPIKDSEQELRHIIVSKNGIIKTIEAENGMIVKNKNDYVKKGDIIISGDIILNEESKGKVSAKGNVYAEVWYQVTVEYPFVYKEEKITNNKKNIFLFRFFNHEISFFDFHPFLHKNIEEIPIIKNNLLPISFVYQHQQEKIVIDEINTKEEAMYKALELAKKKMNENLEEKEEIIYQKILSAREEESKIVCEVFFTVYENITDYQTINEDVQE